MKKHILFILMFMALSAMAPAQSTICWDGTIAETYAGGDGTPENPYQIATAEQLALLAQQTNNGTGGDAYYVLTDNICLNENLNVNPQNWTPIGCVVDSVPAFFTGHFDGRKMTISGLYFDDPSHGEVVGLFGCTNGAIIQNVSLSECSLSGSRFTGGLVGHAGLTDISGCFVEDVSVSCEARSAGGLVGFLGLPYGVNQNSYDTCHVVDCHANQGVTVYGRLSGGLVGEITEYLLWGPSVPTVVSDCTGNALMMGTESVGGLVGFMRNGRMGSCRCWNEVHSGQCAGGMIGLGINVNLTDCQNGVYVSGNYDCGGMVGHLFGGNLTHCENYGVIKGAGDGFISSVGGMIGYYEPDPLLSGSPCENFIRNCHNYEEITDGSDEAGGIVGFAKGSGIEKLFIVDCSNIGQVHNALYAGGILGHSNGCKMRILNVYNTGDVGAKATVGGIVGEMGLPGDIVMNVYNTGELFHEIDTYTCPRGTIVGRSDTNEQFNSCYWLASDEYGSNGHGPELDFSSAFLPTASPSAWQLETPIHNTDDLLTALNLGAELIETDIEFPTLGPVSRWHEDAELSNGGFPIFGNQWPHGTDEPKTTENQFNIYPNPANGGLFVETHGRTSQPTQTYRIINLMGQTLIQGAILSENQQIDISNLPQGMYFVSVGNETRKFVKR